MTNEDLTLMKEFWERKLSKLFNDELSKKELKALMVTAILDINDLTHKLSKAENKIAVENYSILGDK